MALRIKQGSLITWFMVSLILFWSSFIFYIALASVPYNPLSLPQIGKMNILRIIPEGWGFFTRNPVEPSYFLYRRDVRGNFILVNPPATDFSYSLGLNRKSRRINIELHKLIYQISDTAWESINEPKSVQLDTKKLALVHSHLSYPLLQGDYTLVEQQRLPWAWSRQSKQPIMPYKKINVHIVI